MSDKTKWLSRTLFGLTLGIVLYRSYLIGSNQRSTSKKREERKRRALNQMTGGRRIESSKDKNLWDISFRAFLPSRDPICTLPKPFDVLIEIVELLPTLCIEKRVREVLSTTYEIPLSKLNVRDLSDEDSRCRVHSLYSYIVVAFIRDKQDEQTRVPSYLSRGYVEISEILGRKPSLDYADCVLYNWERIDRDGPLLPGNIRLLNRFTGMIDEEWFFKTHVVIESEATPVLGSIQSGLRAIESNDMKRISECLESLERSMWVVSRICLPLMFKRGGLVVDGKRVSSGAPLCDYFMFFNRLRNYIGPLKNVIYEGCFDDKPQNYPGPSGAMSSLLPSLDAFMGIKLSNAKLFKMLRSFESYVPEPHRDFLSQIRNVKQHSNVRDSITSLCSSGTIEAAALVQKYNEVIDRVLDFRWRHLHFVRKFIVEQSPEASRASGTGGSHALVYLMQHINDTSKARIVLDALLSSSNEKFDGPQAAIRDGVTIDVWRVTPYHGFLSARKPPPLTLHVDSKDLCQVLSELHRLVAVVPTYTVRGSEHKMRERIFKCKLVELQNQDNLNLLIRINPALAERVRTVLAFLARVYERSSYEDSKIPSHLQRPLRYLSRKLDRVETLTFVDMVNFNWSFVESPTMNIISNTKRRFSLGRFERANVCILMRFLALEDEEQFWIQHVVIEAHSSNLIAAMKQWRDVAYHASRLSSSSSSSKMQYDWNKIDEAAVSAIQRFGDSLGLLAECHTFGTNPRPDHVLMSRLRKWIEPEIGMSDEKFACHLYVGGSIIIPCVWNILGISNDISRDEMRRVRENIMKIVPPEHKFWLNEMMKFGNARSYIESRSNYVSPATRSLLRTAYNSCLEQFQKLCSRRSRLVCRYLPRIKTSFIEKYENSEQSAMLESRLRRQSNK